MSEVVIISGGSRGLGQALVQRMLERGWVVATFSRSPSPFIDDLLRSHGPETFHYEPVDGRDADRLRGFVATVVARFGRIDALVNNAATVHDGVLALLTEAQIDAMLDVNLRGTLVLTKECVRQMLLQRSGTIVNISSIIGERGFSGLSVYSATKAGLLGLTRSLAREVGSRNIRVNAVAPGYLETEMSSGLDPGQRAQIVRRTPLGRLGTVADVVPCIEFLLSEQSAFITGQVLTVDGGATL